MKSIAMCLALVALSGLASAANADGLGSGGTREQGNYENGVNAKRLGVVVNDADPYSVQVGAYYASRRQIPPENIVHVRITPGRATLSAKEFETIRSTVVSRVPSRVQAFALTWVQPYRVECMSITSAFAFGFEKVYCASGCSHTRASAYFNAHTRIPADSFGIFPTMSLAAATVPEAKALIDRGIASDATNPKGSAYLVTTDDSARNVRARGYDNARNLLLGPVDLKIVALPSMKGRNDLMFYFVGAKEVPEIRTHRYLPGAVADHLTSHGGELINSSQMSALEWIRAGATGSYGTVVEPCAFVEKFPDPTVFLRFYLAGETLIEAYWKSVAMPGQGIFIGEPLARPFARPPSSRDHP